MMKSTLLSILSIFFSLFLYAQDQTKYAELIEEAWNFYESQEYLKSGKKYSEAFVALGNKGMANDRYNASCSWALSGEPDSAFVQLNKITENGSYSNLAHISSDVDLTSLHADERWSTVIEGVRANKEKAEANFDKPLVAMLDTIFQEDQYERRKIAGIEEKHGWDSDEMMAQWAIINKKDSINLIKVRKILDQRGWLGADVIGGQGNQTLFLVIQHADIETQEKYLPIMREAVADGRAGANSLALLEDRVALRKGGKQIYGSQIGRDPITGEDYVLPLTDPDNSDKRRAEVGLGPIQDYISRWGMTWDVEAYKEKLPEYEKMEKN